MIRIFLGNVGSGKTISAVRELVLAEDNPFYLPTYSNIITKKKGCYKLTKNHLITREMLVSKEVVKIKKNGEEEFKIKFNAEFWKSLRNKHNGFNVVIDEAHTLIEARSFMSRQNRVMNDFLALIRKVCNSPENDSTLTLISQLDSRLDINARKLCTEVRYHIGLYDKRCLKCGCYWSEHSDMSDFRKRKKCPSCGGYRLKKFDYRIIVHFFKNMNDYEEWKYHGIDTVEQTLKICNIEKYFPYYDTMQMDDLISEE